MGLGFWSWNFQAKERVYHNFAEFPALLHFLTPPRPIVIDDSSWKNVAESFTIALTLTLGEYKSAIAPNFLGWTIFFSGISKRKATNLYIPRFFHKNVLQSWMTAPVWIFFWNTIPNLNKAFFNKCDCPFWECPEWVCNYSTCFIVLHSCWFQKFYNQKNLYSMQLAIYQ